MHASDMNVLLQFHVADHIKVVIFLFSLPATADSDYNSVIQSITLTPEDASEEHCVELTALPDDILEDVEIFDVTIDSTDQAVQFNRSTSAVHITDVPPSELYSST